MKTDKHFQIDQLVPNLAEYDAIGNYSLKIRDILRRAGYRSDIYVLETSRKLKKQCKYFNEHQNVSSPANILIYHYSTGSPMTEYFRKAAARKILIYHNITPARFYDGINRDIYYRADAGRKELRTFADQVELTISDSNYNRDELAAMGYRRNITLPVILNYDWFERPPSKRWMHELGDGKTNIVFVGRISPNKKQEDLIRAFYYYRNYINPSSRLVLVGTVHQVPGYFNLLKTLLCRLELEDVLFLSDIGQAELNAVYRRAHLFFSASEHEGFGIPLIEAMYFQVPVLAFDAAAVPETMGEAGVLFRGKDPLRTATLMDEILSDADLRRHVVESGNRRLNDFDPAKLEAKFLEMITAFIKEPKKHETADTSNSSGIRRA